MRVQPQWFCLIFDPEMTVVHGHRFLFFIKLILKVYS